MTDKSKFNDQIWLELLKQQKSPPTTVNIAKTYNVSNRVAYAYLFALVNHTELYSDIACASKLASCRNNTRGLKNDNSRLITKNKNQQAHIDFLLAIELLNSSLEDFTKLKISKADMSKDENTAITLFSDSHLEERVEKDIVNNWNEYNPDIAKRRIQNTKAKRAGSYRDSFICRA